MQITLINPRLRSWSPTIVPPLGLAYIASVLDTVNYVKIVDMNTRKVSDKELENIGDESNLIGITGMITEYDEVKRISSIVKRNQNTVVVGGALASTFPDEIIAFPQVDYVVVGEGEYAVTYLETIIKERIKIENHIIRMPQLNDLNVIPFPARHLLNMNKYNTQFHYSKDNIKATTMITSRGCPYGCTFCYKDMWGYKWRGRSPQNMMEEMSTINRDYGINGFIFNDDTFVLNRERVIDFCELIRYCDYKWMCNGRVNLVDMKLLEIMAKSGCVEIAYGIESGSQDMLNKIRKGITLSQISDAVKWSKQAGMRVNGYFMIGLPGETKESIKMTIDFAEKLDLDFYGFSLVTPMPNTELYRYAMKNGYLSNDYALSLSDWSFKANVNMTVDCTDKELQELKNDVFVKFTIKKFGFKYLVRRFFDVLKGIQNINELKLLLIKVFRITRSIS